MIVDTTRKVELSPNHNGGWSTRLINHVALQTFNHARNLIHVQLRTATIAAGIVNLVESGGRVRIVWVGTRLFMVTNTQGVIIGSQTSAAPNARVQME